MAAPPAIATTAIDQVDAKAWTCVDFLSDVHLHSAEAATAAAWKDYLRHSPAQALFILGDLFEVWVGDDVLHHPMGAFEQSCAQALAECARLRPVFFLWGNRDFLIGPAFFALTGVQALRDPCRIDSSAGALLLSHGDALCTEDHEYQAFRAQVRSSAWQSAFLSQSLPDRMAQARAMRAQSQARQQNMVSLPDVNTPACDQALVWHHAHTLIHGHTHRPGWHLLGEGRQRRVLSDWQAEGPQPRTEVLRLLNGQWQRVPLAQR
ncbi:MAG: UDP-2,3-diacylglucosamine diphosphatase [Betaproteobacteria bacterium]|nr:UDP-2,3-diacylglucosamine diphosphatase [Betaproteobacteria bacterium]NBY04981.1 UDP-2,3-diacylglucosamine diphosphatase [Betaproteobacteria bacterium]